MILVSKLKSDLRIWVHANIPPEIIDNLQDSDFAVMWNYVARDINDLAQVHVEKFYQKATADNAEDANLTNYLLQGVIRKIFQIYYWDDAASNQYYTWNPNTARLILKVAAVENTIIEIYYLRDIEEVVSTDDTDEVDLPEEAYFEFLDLVKAKLKSDYLRGDDSLYQVKLQAVARQMLIKVKSPLLKTKVQGTWMGGLGDDRYYDITDKYIGIENFTVDVNGIYTHVDE